MKKYFGKNIIPSINIQTNLDLQILIPKMELLETMGYEYNGLINNHSIIALENKIFLEKNIDNPIEGLTIKLKENINSDFYPKYKIPILINESLYWNNLNLQEYQYFYIRSIDIHSFNNQNYEYQYTLLYSDGLLDTLLSNNFAGIKSERDFGMLKAGVSIQCTFVIEYNKYYRNVIILKILHAYIEDSL